jgi:hypothetical protein
MAEKKDKAYWDRDKKQQAAVDKRGYYSESDVARLNKDPKFRHNAALSKREAADAKEGRRKGTAPSWHPASRSGGTEK